MITIIDYGRGNLFSLAQALSSVGAAHRITSEPSVLASAARIVFPGVGAFGDAAEGLRSRGLEAPLIEAAGRGIPILGICVGCQLLLDEGEEFGRHRGVGLIPGSVRRLPDPIEGDPAAIRIPNVGWRRLTARAHDPLTGPLDGEMVYFVHSFAPMVREEVDAAAQLHINGLPIPVAIRRKNVAGVQFHPEKSGPVGLALLARFAAWNG
jgi:glutamine amidotransferase